MAPHSSTLAWKIPGTEEPGGLQSMGSLRVGHDWATSLSLFTFMHWRRKWQPTPVFLPGESQGWGAWWAAVYGFAQSQTRLKQLSSRSSWSMLTLMLFLCNFHEIWYIKNKFIFLRTKCFFWSWVSQLPIHGRNFNDFLAYTANTSNKFIGYIITEQEHVQFLWNYRIYKPF